MNYGIEVFALHEINTLTGVASIVGIYEKEKHAYERLANAKKVKGDTCHYWVTEESFFE